MSKILIIEDEPKVALFIKQGLEENSYQVEVASDGISGKEIALNNSFDAIILDLNLPLLNGYEVCKEIRQKDSAVPILMLTALGTMEDKLSGFETGADDYIIKPFEFRELMARIKALLKRATLGKSTDRIIRLADLELNMDTKTVRRSNKLIELTPKEFSLLEYLMLNKGNAVSRQEISEKIWEIYFVTGTNVIDVYINFLRKKIDKNFSSKLIHTCVGKGYSIKELDQ